MRTRRQSAIARTLPETRDMTRSGRAKESRRRRSFKDTDSELLATSDLSHLATNITDPV